MSIKQTEAPQEGLLLLLPAAAKWLSGDTYEMGKIVPYAEFKKSFGRLLTRVTLPELKLHLPELKQSYRNANNVEGATSTEIFWGYEVLVHVLVATALWLYEEYA